MIPYQREIELQAREAGFDPALVASVVEQESGFNARAYRYEAHLDDASWGLMQTLLSTARWMGYPGSGEGLYDPSSSLAWGLKYLDWCRRNTKSERNMLAAYNAGLAGYRNGLGYADQVLSRVATMKQRMTMVELDVPYISQLEGGSGYNNCGPAVLAMLLAYDGVIPATQSAMHEVADWIRDGEFDGDWWLGTYTDYPMMVEYCRFRYGITARVLSSWEAVYREIGNGRPVGILAYNGSFSPAPYPKTKAWLANHFIVIRGDGDNLPVNDPLAYYTPGPGYFARWSVEAGVASVGGVHAIVLDKREEDVAITPDQQAILDAAASLGLDKQGIYDLNTRVSHYENVQIPNLEDQIRGQNGVINDFSAQLDNCQRLKTEVEDRLTRRVGELEGELANRPDQVVMPQTPKKIHLEFEGGLTMSGEITPDATGL